MKEKKEEEEAVSDGCGALVRLCLDLCAEPSTKSNSAQAHGANLDIGRTQTTWERHEPEILVSIDYGSTPFVIRY